MYPNSIKNVIDCLKDLPGIGEKTAERLAFSLINFDKDKLTLFSESYIRSWKGKRHFFIWKN